MDRNINRNDDVAGERGGLPQNGNARNGPFRNGRMHPRVERAGRRQEGFEALQAPRGVPQLGFHAQFAAGAPVNAAFQGVPQPGVPLQHAIHVVPPLYDTRSVPAASHYRNVKFLHRGRDASGTRTGRKMRLRDSPLERQDVGTSSSGQQLGVAHHAPMLLIHPGVVNAVVVPHPAVNVAGVVGGAQPRQEGAGLPPHVLGLPYVGAGQQGRGAQPRRQGAGLPPHVVRLPHVGADQQGRDIRNVTLEVIGHLLEVEKNFLSLYDLLVAHGDPVPANAVIQPYAFELFEITEGVENYKAHLSETYARFAREEGGLLGALMRTVSQPCEMYERLLFLLDVHLNARVRAV